MSADDELYFTFDLGENNSINADFDLEENNSIDANFNIYAAGTTWGSITGNLEEQTDLSDILNTFNGQITSNHNEITSLSNTIQTYGDIVTYDAADFATSNQGVLASTALQPGDNITRLTNNARYITASALNGYATEAWVNNKGYITGITSNDVTNALGYTPYNNTNPRGFITRADLPTLEDLTTTAQLNAINSGATTALINQITTNKNAITSETTNRQNADNNLQSQIDAITAASDVTDIVGTYAQLQAYDTSSLPPNSIIKVLQDESQNNETTYYRWVITGGVGSWVLIGEEGPYYTKSESDSIFVPQTRTINGYVLSNNISLTASDVGALTSADLVNYVTTNTAQDISGVKTFLGEKAIHFKQQAATNKLGFTLYNASNAELGALEYRPNTINGGALLNVNVPYSSSDYVGFRYWGTAVNVIAPKVSTAGNYYIPVNVTDGTNTVTANSTGTVDISSLTSITSSDVTNALGYTPYNSTNPNGYTSNVGTVTSVNNEQPDSAGNVAIIPNPAYGTSDTAAATVQKEISIPEITELNVGQIIVVQPTETSSVANSTIRLNNFTAYPMKYNGAAISTSTDSIVWGATFPSMFIFDGSNWVFLGHGLDSNTTYTINYMNDAGAITAGTGTYAITRDSLVMQKPNGTWEKVTATNATYSTGTAKSVNTSGFLLANGVKYYTTTTTVAGGSTTSSIQSQSASVDMRYSTNCGATPGWASGDIIYFVGTIGADGLFYLDTTTWWTNTLPNSNDGKIYIQLGQYTDVYKISLMMNNPAFYHDGTGIKQYIPSTGGGGATIDDNTPSTTTVYSSQKTQDLIDALTARIMALEANINGGNA